jgi:lysophospholipase L1-like esterase
VKSHRIALCRAALWTLAGATLSAVAAAEVPPFKDGERVCFIGDSITHQAQYHTEILLFYTTRFPQMRLTCWNCGFAGDTAAGAVKRYAWDIAPRRPTVATIMLGMNDVNRGLYAQGKSGPEVAARRQAAIANNTASMDRLAELLSRDGTRIIFITPSLFDQTGNQSTERLAGVNDALKACAEADRKLAARYGGGLVDFNGPMEAINKAGQAQDPGFTIVGSDRVHPGPVGHLVMAYLFLKAQGLSPLVAKMEIDAAQKTILKQDNCRVSAISANDGEVCFEYLAKALPFPVTPANEKVLEIVPFTDDLNQETLKVAGLAAGAYELSIDDRPILRTTAAALSGGINLATVRETPQFKQAEEVRSLLTERALIEGRKLRTFAQANYLFFSDLKVRSPEIERKVLAETSEKLRGHDDKWSRYRRGVIESYRQLLPQKESLARKSAELAARIDAIKVPKPHAYKLHPVH